ncbi:hypothetical protein RHSIM_Rhsim11G0009800 [Rhododendron simsii]|uniref:Reverse transcriptase domain-containing protein n=1 Tax=Rhododendron simsii TaxID=118357 RepID=A0A834LBN5_RHOSS|nr:hypothetical protein RHSIM_Rhsim11G0009800 [Rhododendron simsii]
MVPASKDEETPHHRPRGLASNLEQVFFKIESKSVEAIPPNRNGGSYPWRGSHGQEADEGEKRAKKRRKRKAVDMDGQMRKGGEWRATESGKGKKKELADDIFPEKIADEEKKQGHRVAYKAYDRVQWDFLEEVMRKMGFCDEWIHWVMQIVSIVSYTVTANGKNRFSFLPSRGRRQGDPLSPYLFLFIMDVLSVMLCKGIRNNLINSLRIKRGCPLLSHVLFADDALLFVSNEKKGLQNLKLVLDQFCAASGQLINFDKSSICFSANSSEEAKRDVCNLLSMPAMGTDSKYLGLPFFWGRSKSEAHTFLIEKAITKMKGWKTKDLNAAGKETLIKHVVQAIPTYAMACFALSQKFCNKLNKYVRRFWWSGSPDEAKIHWVSSDDLCKAKSQGGLGFRYFKCFNLALLAKQGWRLLQNPNAFWARLLKSLYFPNGNFMEALIGSRPSWAWASILQGRELLMKGTRWQIHNGVSVDFWVDKWIPSLPSFCIQSPKPPWISSNKVADFINPTTGEWRAEKLKQVLTTEEVQAVTYIPLSIMGDADSIVWGLHPSGKYTVKRGYQKAWSNYISSKPERPSSSTVPEPSFWNFLWNLKIPPKLKHFWWHACCNRVASKENLVSSSHTPPPPPPHTSSAHWSPPATGSLKINCDASWSKELNKGWGGIILRDSLGNLIDGRRFRISATSALLAKASVIREACLFAKALNLSSVCIENDNAQLISLSVSELVPPWEVLAIISDIRLLAKNDGFSFRWTPREGNEAAHWVASSQASSLGPNWVVYPPEFLYSILCKDLS